MKMDASALKKLITGFLILSAISGSLTLIFLNFAGQGTPSPSFSATGTETQNPLLDSAGSPLAIGKNAFVEQLPQNSFAQHSPQTGAVSGSISADNQTADASNLTKNFANVFAQQVIAHNPQGPRIGPNGRPTALNLPNEDAATALIQQAITSSTLTVDEKISDGDLNVKKEFSTAEASGYLKNVYGILDQVAASTHTQSLTSQQPNNLKTIAATQLILDSAVQKLFALSVPQPAVQYHRRILKLLADQKKVLELALNYQADPLKTLVVIQSEAQIADRDFQNFQIELQKIIGPQKVSGLKENSWLSLFNNLLGVPRAYAQFGTEEDATTPVRTAAAISTVLNTLQKLIKDAATWLYTTALRAAVTVLIDQFQNQVVNWIAGNGNPKFITDWKGFLTDAADKAIGQALSESKLQFLCAGIRLQVRVALLPVPGIGAVRCTLTQVIQNVQNFYNNFQNGGWIAYGATLQPQNNFYGSLIQVNDDLLRQVGLAQEAAKNEAVASQGFLSVTKKTGKCLASHEENDYDYSGNVTKITICDQEEEISVTPGSAVSHSLFGANDWKIQQFSTAQRFEELVNAILNAGINRMIRQGLSALTEASNPPPTRFDNALPAGVPNPGDASSLKSSLQSLVDINQQNGAFQKFQDIANADSQWLNLEPQAITFLNKVASSCASLATSSQEKIDALNSLKIDVQRELRSASSTTLDSVKTQIANATSSQALIELTNRLQGLDLAVIGLTADAAAGRLTRLQNLIENAQANLPNQCTVPLSNP